MRRPIKQASQNEHGKQTPHQLPSHKGKTDATTHSAHTITDSIEVDRRRPPKTHATSRRTYLCQRLISS